MQFLDDSLLPENQEKMVITVAIINDIYLLRFI